MRRVSSRDFPLGTAFHKTLAGVLSLAIVLGPASAVAYDDERYTYTPPRVQDYQNQYRPQNNFSPSFQLDRQINNMNSVLTFKQNVGFTAPKIDLKTDQIPRDTFKPKILFQLAMANPIKAPVQDAKPLQPITIGKPGFFGAVQSIFKGIGTGFQKVGQAIGNVIQRVFTRSEKPGAVSPQQKEILAQHPNLQPTGPNAFVSVGKATVAFGKVWEPGSTFTAKDGNLRLNQGVSLESSFGGIKDKNGGLLPVSMANVDGAITPVGLDFDRMRAGTALLVSQPTRVDGLGTIRPGEMTYQGPVKDAANTTIGGRFNFQGMKVDLEQDAARQFGVDPTVTIKQATFALQAGLMRLNSAVLEQGEKRLFIQESKPPLNLSEIEKKISDSGDILASAMDQHAKAEKNYSHAALAARSLLNTITQSTGQTELPGFNNPGELVSLKAEMAKLSVSAKKINADMGSGDYQSAADALSTFLVQAALLNFRAEALAARAEMTKTFFRYVRQLASDLGGLGSVIDMGEIKSNRCPPIDQVANGFGRYPAKEKIGFAKTADSAQKSLLVLAQSGAVDPTQALDWALTIAVAKAKVLAAGPSTFGDRLKLAAKYPQASIKEATSEAADFYVFDKLAEMANSLPRTIEAVGHVGYVVSKGARVLGQASTVGLMVVFPATSLAALSTGYAVDKGLQSLGVNDDLSGFIGMGAGVVVGVSVANTGKISTLETAWARRIGGTNSVAQVWIDLRNGLRNSFSWSGNAAQGQAGHLYIGGLTKPASTSAAAESAVQRSTAKPWGKEDPFAFFMREVEKLDVSTKPNQTVLYSGVDKVKNVKNRAHAETFAREHGKLTLEMTPGGKWLDRQRLFEPGSPLTGDQANLIWSRLSERFAGGATGEVNAFTFGSKSGSIFDSVEYPTIKATQKVHQVIFRDGR